MREPEHIAHADVVRNALDFSGLPAGNDDDDFVLIVALRAKFPARLAGVSADGDEPDGGVVHGAIRGKCKQSRPLWTRVNWSKPVGMKLGFLTGQYRDITKAKKLGFAAIELNTGALGDAKAGALDKKKIRETKTLLQQTGVTISALAFYDVAWAPPAPADFVKTFERVFDAAEALDVGVIASMSGFDPKLDWDGNLKLWTDRFGPVAAAAERRGLKIAFENWMSVHGRLPHKPCNFGGCPGLWREWFRRVPSPALGLEFDPSHLYWQGIDHVRAVKEFGPRVHHVHAKDTEMLPEARYEWGVNQDNFRFRIPGYGGINWAEFISALDEIGYRGGVAIEHEDPVYGGERFDEGLVRGWQVLHPLVKA